MKAKGRFISTLLCIDAFLVSYYFGMHDSLALAPLFKVGDRPYKVIDPKLPAVQVPEPKPVSGDGKDASAEKVVRDSEKKNADAKAAGAKNVHPIESVDKKAGVTKSSGKKGSQKKDSNKSNGDEKVSSKADNAESDKPATRKDAGSKGAGKKTVNPSVKHDTKPGVKPNVKKNAKKAE